jgi:AcrR family transcriptional regulator
MTVHLLSSGIVNGHSFIYHGGMPRPRTASDADILEAASRAIARLGPAKVTLADVAREVQLSPATLVQRFGSKRGLLLALAKMGADSVEDCFAAVRAAHAAPLAALIAAVTEMARQVTSPEELANGLAFLQMDVSEPDFHSLALENSRRIEAGYRALLEEAVVAGELIPCDTARLARAVGAISGGSLLAWAIHREGTAEAWVRADLATLLDHYRRPTTGTKATGRRGRKSRRSQRRR